ncbi:MAG: cation:proton antiporter [Gemmatimonadaceae bacterium]
MPHDTLLIATVAAGLGVAFVLGLLAVRLKLPPIVGYLMAGVVVGPFTPGFVADAGLAKQLAELGAILLMFGVGLHFSLRDLAAVQRVVVPGALLQTFITGSLGVALGRFWGWSWGGGIVLGLSLSVASTVVLLKGLEGRDRLDSAEGRIAVGWLVVEDLTMVFALVLLPALAPILGGTGASATTGTLLLSIGIAIAKVLGFIALMFVVGRRFIPWLLEHVAKVGSRELFTLAVLVAALGIGTIASELFGVSFALGAFFAGAVISESELSHRAASDALPMQDAFAVLFFVSVGMLFDPAAIMQRPWHVLSLVVIIVAWKALLAFGLVRVLGEGPRTALVIGTALGQIGEFSFIVAALGVTLGLVDSGVQALLVTAAIIAITVNGPLLALAERFAQRIADNAAAVDAAAAAPAPRKSMTMQAFDALYGTRTDHDFFGFSELAGHVVLVGYGRVGATVADALRRAGVSYVVIEEQERVVGGLRKHGEHAIQGDATRADVLDRAGIRHASLLVVTAPEPIRARRIVDVAQLANPLLEIAVRTHSAAEQAYFEQHLKKGRAVYAEREAALSLAHYALQAIGKSDDEADGLVSALRGQPTAPTQTFESLPTQEYQALARMGLRGGRPSVVVQSPETHPKGDANDS